MKPTARSTEVALVASAASEAAIQLVADSAPVGASWQWRAFDLQLRATQISGVLRINADSAPIDWTDASDQALTVQACDSMGTVVLSATLTVGITPAA